MATIVRVPSTRDGGKPAYRAQVRVRGRVPESRTFPNSKQAKAWADSVEAAFREGRDFPHAAARRTSFDALCEDYTRTVLGEARESTRAARTEQLKWWVAHFAGKTLAEITRDTFARGRDALAAETFAREKLHQDKKTGEIVAPKQYKRSGATVNRYLAALSHVLSFAV
jgi:hypothetical protein